MHNQLKQRHASHVTAYNTHTHTHTKPPPAPQEVETHVPERVRQQLARLRPRLYTIDATNVAREVGLGRRTNMVMQAAFFALSGVMPMEQVGRRREGRALLFVVPRLLRRARALTPTKPQHAPCAICAAAGADKPPSPLLHTHTHPRQSRCSRRRSRRRTARRATRSLT